MMAHNRNVGAAVFVVQQSPLIVNLDTQSKLVNSTLTVTQKVVELSKSQINENWPKMTNDRRGCILFPEERLNFICRIFSRHFAKTNFHISLRQRSQTFWSSQVRPEERLPLQGRDAAVLRCYFDCCRPKDAKPLPRRQTQFEQTVHDWGKNWFHKSPYFSSLSRKIKPAKLNLSHCAGDAYTRHVGSFRKRNFARQEAAIQGKHVGSFSFHLLVR